jgi:uncharacterized protein with NRDE domain
MCIVLMSTAHPSYALIVLDNRDELILRPTSRPHWWLLDGQRILSARDLQRAEQGTWLGVTKSGNLAILTNWREAGLNDKDGIQGKRSRGEVVKAWLTTPSDEPTVDFVHRLLSGDALEDVGGFSLVCGRLRKRADGRLEPLAIISNRWGSADDVPWVAEGRGEVYGLSNTHYADHDTWPKVRMGKELVTRAVKEAIENGLDEEALVERLYRILDTDTLPPPKDECFEEYIMKLEESIFIREVGRGEFHGRQKAKVIATAGESGTACANGHLTLPIDAEEQLRVGERPDPAISSHMTGVYGTQRQTIVLVDWEGKVTFRERSLWDAEGNPIPRGEADMKFEFNIEGWHGASTASGAQDSYV